MSSPSAKLELILPTQVDRFNTAELRGNWEKVDAAPGAHICTSTTRPSWNVAKAGRTILENDTGLQWRWTGTAWARIGGGTGILRRSDGTLAVAERTTDFSTTSDTFVKVVSVTGVVVPAGNRTLMAIVTWRNGTNSANWFLGSIFRSNTNASGPQIGTWVFPNPLAGGGSFVGVERGGLAAGVYDFSFQIRCQATSGGTSLLVADSVTPISIAIVEI